MSLREEILSTQALKDAMKSKDTVKLGVIRFLKSEIQRSEGGKSEMNETQVSNLIKKTIQSVTENKDGDWEKEVETLSEFLPKQLGEDEIRSIVTEMVDNGMNSMGQIMGSFQKEYGGKADGKLVSSIVREKLEL
jgi:uncharacterized protein YqeY